MTKMYTAVVFITSFSMAVMMAAVKGDSFMERGRKRGFLLLFGLLIAANLAEWLAASLEGAAAGLRTLHILAKFAELTLTPVIPAVCGTVLGGKQDGKLTAAPIVINVVLQLVSLFAGVVFTVDALNVYHRGPLYPLYMSTFICGGVILFVRCYRFSRRYQNRNGFFLVLIAALVVGAMALPIADRDLRLDWTCTSIAAILFYIYYGELVQQVDALTALMNRHSYNCRIESLSRPAVILFFDVDHFKNVNDRYGHPFGDVCLARMADKIKTVFGKYGHCYRFGGDEFCVILTREDADPEKLISEYLGCMEALREEESRMPLVSVGYARFEPGKESPEDALKRADEMMYVFKQKHHAEEQRTAAPGPAGA